MATLTMKDFEKQYSINLLPYSTADVKLGDMMDYKGFLNKKLEFLDYNLVETFPLNDSQKETFLQQLATIVPVAADLPNIDATHDFNADGGFKIPFINLDLSGKVDKDNISKFTFTNVTAKRLTGEVRWKIEEFLAQLKQKDFQTYQEKISGHYIIEGLFYAENITISLSNNAQLNLNATSDFGNLKGINVAPDLTSNGTSNYTIAGAGQCPFAVQLVKGEEF